MRIVVAALLLLAAPTAAVMPDEQLADPVLEQRARQISQQLRCVVCQNQSIDESDAPLAKDLRVIVREQLRVGKTDEQAIGYMVERYGSYVLLKPPFAPATWLLWLGPFLVVALGGWGVARWTRSRRPATDAAALTADEQAGLAALLRDGD